MSSLLKDNTFLRRFGIYSVKKRFDAHHVRIFTVVEQKLNSMSFICQVHLILKSFHNSL